MLTNGRAGRQGPPLVGKETLSGTCFLRETALPQTFRYDESKLERLGGVQPWVTVGMVARAQVLKQHVICATNALRHVLASHFKVNSSRMGTFLLMDVEESAQLSLQN